jgi:hypothetical protein
MTALPTAPPRQDQIVDPVKVFTARAEARALLWAEGAVDLHTAVDELWVAAESEGLVKQLGADAVQRILADAFAPARDDMLLVDLLDDLSADLRDEVPDAEAAPLETGIPDNSKDEHENDDYDGLSSSFARACRQADERVRAQREQQHERSKKTPGAAASTLRAAEHLVREGDAKRFRSWLARHSADERGAIIKHLERKKKAPAT